MLERTQDVDERRVGQAVQSSDFRLFGEEPGEPCLTLHDLRCGDFAVSLRGVQGANPPSAT